MLRSSWKIVTRAGASAGGINTLLAALTWSVNTEKSGGFANRIDDNIFRDVWLTPDVNRLLPMEPDSPQYLTDDARLVLRVLREGRQLGGTALNYMAVTGLLRAAG